MTEIEDLRRRLAAAERVCYLVGITGATGSTDRDKAKTQAWMEWSHEYGNLAVRLTDDEVLALAARREVIRNNTLVRLRAKTRAHLEAECKATVLEALYERQHEPEVTHTWEDWRQCQEFPEFEQRGCRDDQCLRVQTRRREEP